MMLKLGEVESKSYRYIYKIIEWFIFFRFIIFFFYYFEMYIYFIYRNRNFLENLEKWYINVLESYN